MKDKIILLSNYLRKEGMSVSIRSTALAKEVVDNYGNIMTFDEFYTSLKTVYVKNVEDINKFDRVFKKIFKQSVNKKRKLKDKSKLDNKDMIDTDGYFSNSSGENNEELEKLYDEIAQYKSDTPATKGKLLNQSMVVLDNSDEKIFELCRKLSRKIANNRSKRRKKNHSHHIDMSKTIRTNMKYGGHFIKLICDKPPIKKTKHIFLCDVSGSCEWVTAWFFLLIYGCSSTFNNVTVYTFDNRVTDITSLLGNEGYGSIGQIHMAQREKGIYGFGQSDMAKSFKEFLDMAYITKRTDIIIMTDCRDWKGKRIDGVLESAILMKDMAKKARRVIILNPEKKIRWNNATSCVEDYEKAGIEIFETSNLKKFEEVITKL